MPAQKQTKADQCSIAKLFFPNFPSNLNEKGQVDSLPKLRKATKRTGRRPSVYTLWWI